MNAEEIIKTITEEIATMISTKTVIGEHITIDGRIIIPVTRVSFGFGSGGGTGRNKAGEEGIGSGGAGGASIQPIAFLVITPEDVQLLSIKGKGTIARLAEIMPEMMEKYEQVMERRKKEESYRTEEE
ncbi:hypothetical protein ANME2D_00478 [Candidatus Methanoperedens nitroreducens]|uniref:Sporulation protein YtfJ n=1 Tax=Candidatus Methanoperedens nitratireducens TaxID=1392998 RepID=A0A062V802_9EURY|nr:spore germination protein GerW family protein [Candidatus Methanoperedens nitroreducens]KCZ73412.1 hypothetical protein ANME2D_00478 [Candidatus Methanoperedens nitroreducens]MDJ1422633.1 spore germination protein GerW family protein [Candidatus Methanoperedens sp.]